MQRALEVFLEVDLNEELVRSGRSKMVIAKSRQHRDAATESKDALDAVDAVKKKSRVHAS